MVCLIRKLQPIFPTSSLLTIYKTFARPHLDYKGIIYDQIFNASIHKQLESVQYSTCLAITGIIRSTSFKRLNQEFGLEALQIRRWPRKLSLFYKIVNNQSPCYFSDNIPSTERIYNGKHDANVPNVSIF